MIIKYKILFFTLIMSCLFFTNKSKANLCDTFSVVDKNIHLYLNEELNTNLTISGQEKHYVFWELLNSKNEMVYNGTGISVKSIFLKIPDSYLLVFKEHIQFGKKNNFTPKSDTAFVFVHSSRLKFNFDKVSFSSPLKVNEDLSGIEMSVNVYLESLDNQDLTLNLTPVQTAGLNTTIEAIPIQESIILKKGTNILKYKLKGSIQNNRYISFDFKDHIGNISPFYFEFIN